MAREFDSLVSNLRPREFQYTALSFVTEVTCFNGTGTQA
jgi:hypothetical protein